MASALSSAANSCPPPMAKNAPTTSNKEMPRLAAAPLHCRFCKSRVCALCVVRCALCVVRCALCVVRCALCVVRCALCVDANRIHLWFLRLWFVRFIIPHLSTIPHFRHSRVGGNPPFCHFAICAKAQTAIYRRKWQTTAAALPPVIMGGKAALHTAAFSHLALQDGLRYAQIAKMRR